MTFLEKYELLKKSIPVPAVSNGPHTIKSEYIDKVFRSENCYYCFDSAYLKNSLYTTIGIWCNKLVDCSAVTESEKCYKCIDSNKCYNSTYLVDCNNCTDCHYSTFLSSCSDCFGCVSLTHKKYCIFNKQYTKDEYFKKLEELKSKAPEKLLEKMFAIKEKVPHPASMQGNNENCPYGDYIYNSKNSYWCFNSYYCENSAYIYVSAGMKNCWDNFFCGSPDGSNYSQKSYEMVDSGPCYESAYLTGSNDCANCFYSINLSNCSDCFGCVGLTNKKYCILNNQLTKEQYEKAVREIKRELGWKI